MVESFHIPRALSDEALRLLTTLPMQEIEARLRGSAPAAGGEVAKLVALLRHEAAEDEECDHTHWLTPFDMRRAADLLERQAASLPVARLSENAQVIEPVNRAILVPVSTPIPVSERLPEPDDCAGAGDCWWYSSFMSAWIIGDVEYGKHHRFRHWLPAHALPLPEVE